MFPNKETKISKHITGGLGDLLAACPYTLLGKKLLSDKQGQQTGGPPPTAHEEHRIRHKIRLGRNIALIGVFCPFFWLSLLSGAYSKPNQSTIPKQTSPPFQSKPVQHSEANQSTCFRPDA